jgi:putative addiction module component (TIGR02574 family)
MSKVEILSELPKLSAAEREEIRARIAELDHEGWLDEGELSPEEKATLESRLDDFDRHPNAGSPWDEAHARIQARLPKK